MYCLCSDKSFASILESQRCRPLPFEEMINEYTECESGCGSCIPWLRAEAQRLGLLDAADEPQQRD